MGAGASALHDGMPVLSMAEMDKITPVGSLVSREMLEKLRALQLEAHSLREVAGAVNICCCLLCSFIKTDYDNRILLDWMLPF